MTARKAQAGRGTVVQEHRTSAGCPPPVNGVRPKHKCYRPWIAKITITDPSGKVTRPSVKRATQKEAQAALRDLIKDAERGLTRHKYTLGQWVTEYIDEVLGDSIRERTRDGYKVHARYIEQTIGGLGLEEVQPADVRDMHRKLKAKGLGGTTIAHVHSLLRAALNRAVAERLLEWNPASVVDPPKMSVRHFQQPTEDEARAIIAAAQTPRELARVAVAWLALRPSEVLALLWDDIHEDADVPYLQVTGSEVPVKGKGMVRGEPKTERSKAPVPLPAWTAEALRMWRIQSGGVGYVFPNLREPHKPMRIEADLKWWHAYCTKAGVRSDLPRYGIRGAVASQLDRAGASPRVIADTLRHANPDTAQKHYVTTVQPQVLAALEAVTPRKEQP